MPTVTLKQHDGFPTCLAKGTINFATDTFKMMLLDNNGSTSSDAYMTQYSDDDNFDFTALFSQHTQANAGGKVGYAEDGITMTGLTMTETSAGVLKIDWDDVIIPQDAGGFTENSDVVIIWSETAYKMVAFAHLAADTSNVSNSLVFSWGAAGVLTIQNS